MHKPLPMIYLQRLFLFSLLAICLACGTCDPDIRIGTYLLTPTSHDFFAYTGSETLTFVDQDGLRHTLSADKGLQLRETRTPVRDLCESGFLDKQVMYYESEMQELAFFDEQGSQVFYLQLNTSYEDNPMVDSIAIYDILRIETSLFGQTNGRLALLTSNRQNEVSASHLNDFISPSPYLGDTTLYGRPFTDVYCGLDWNGRTLFYTTSLGVVAFTIDEDQYWVLEE